MLTSQKLSFLLLLALLAGMSFTLGLYWGELTTPAPQIQQYDDAVFYTGTQELGA